MKWKFIGILAVGLIFLVAGSMYIFASEPPSIDVFVERWDVLPPVYEGLIILGPRGYHGNHEIQLASNPSFPTKLMVYYWRPTKSFVVRLAGRMGLDSEILNLTGKPFISMDF